MDIIKQEVELLDINKETAEAMKKRIEFAGRLCYKTENNIADESYSKFIKGIVKRGHESVIEHGVVSIRIITNRAISHEIVRHRIASYSQESTRYCNYSKDKFGGELTFILPNFISVILNKYNIILPCTCEEQAIKVMGEMLSMVANGIGKFNKMELSRDLRLFQYWINTAIFIDDTYKEMANEGMHADEMRGILTNDIKTELVMTANLREWRHFIKLRNSKAAHPQVREIANLILKEMKIYFEEIFFDIDAMEESDDNCNI